MSTIDAKTNQVALSPNWDSQKIPLWPLTPHIIGLSCLWS
jgi:hypothetical protein